MADEDKDSKTEDATDKRVRDAIEEGNVPRLARSFDAGVLHRHLHGSQLPLAGNVIHLMNALSRFIDDPGGWELESSGDAHRCWRSSSVSDAVTPAGPRRPADSGRRRWRRRVLQNPPQSRALKRITPDLSRISLKKGIEAAFQPPRLVDFGKSVFKLVAVAQRRISSFSRRRRPTYWPRCSWSRRCIPGLLREVLLRIIGWVALLTLALVAADLFWSRFRWRKELRMTKQEVKDEYKQSEGDPKIKARFKRACAATAPAGA